MPTPSFNPRDFLPLPTVCQARNRKGAKCGQLTMLGMRVCYYHGGASPNARDGARRRLAALRDQALESLLTDLESDRPMDPRLKLEAVIKLTPLIDGMAAKGQAGEPGQPAIDHRGQLEQVLELLANRHSVLVRGE